MIQSIQDGQQASPSDESRPHRFVYLDVLRLIALFCVVINHTAGPYALSLEPKTGLWWLLIAYFFVCKIAVPLFVMITGALLLGRECPYGKTLRRIAKVAIALVVFSVFYRWMHGADLSLPEVLRCLRTGKVNYHLWYLYVYIGILLMLPLLSRLEAGMDRRDFLYLIIGSLVISGTIPMLTAFDEKFAIAEDFSAPLFGSYIGMLFMGRYLSSRCAPTRKSCVLAVLVFAACLSFLVLTTGYFADANEGGRYLVLDDRTLAPIVLMAASVFIIVRGLCEAAGTERAEREGSFGIRLLATLSDSCFGAYLIHAAVNARCTGPLLGLFKFMPAVPALLLVELVIFSLSLAIAWALRLIPPVRKLL